MLSVLIPAYNEEAMIGKVIDDLNCSLLPDFRNKFEIIVINDCSTDKTEEIARSKKVKLINNPVNVGYGKSLKSGVREAKYQTIVTVDADNTYQSADIPKLYKEYVKGFHLLIAARNWKTFKESLTKRISRSIFLVFVSFIVGRNVKDANSGLRMFDKDHCIRLFPLLCDTFSFSTTMTISFYKTGLFVGFIDSEYFKRSDKSKVRPLKDMLLTLQYLFESVMCFDPLKLLALIGLFFGVLGSFALLVNVWINSIFVFLFALGLILVGVFTISMGLLAAQNRSLILDKYMEKERD